MELTIRETHPGDIEGMFSVRARTRQNPISKERLAAYGVTSESSAADMANGTVKGWACFHGPVLVGFCNGHRTTGEVLVLAVLPAYEGMGIGKRLLAHAVQWLRSMGFEHPWLAASPDPTIRAHGFYRALGWRHMGRVLESGDEVLQLQPNNALQATCEDARVSTQTLGDNKRMITRTEVMPLLLAACPSFGSAWHRHVEELGNDEPLLYGDLGEFAHHLVHLLKTSEVSEFESVFRVVELLHTDGDAYVREAATIGLLEAIQNVAGHSHIDPEAYVERLGPETAKWWSKLNAFWNGNVQALNW